MSFSVQFQNFKPSINPFKNNFIRSITLIYKKSLKESIGIRFVSDYPKILLHLNEQTK